MNPNDQPNQQGPAPDNLGQEPVQNPPQSPPDSQPAVQQPAVAPVVQPIWAAEPSQQPVVNPLPVQSQAPIAPTGPTTASTSFASTPPNPPGTDGGGFQGIDKKLIIWIAAGIGALLLVIIAIVLVVSSLSVSKDDYKQAYEQINDTRKSYSKMSSLSSISTYSTNTELKNDLESFKKSQKEFGDDFDLLGETKAIQRDSEAAKLYNAASAKKDSFDKAVLVLVETYEYILPAMSEFNGASSSDLSEMGKVVNSSIVKLEATQDKIKDSNNKELVSKLVPLFKRYAALLDKVAVYRSDYSKYDSKVASDFSSTARNIRTTIRDWSSNQKKTSNDMRIADEFNDLNKYLSKKSLGA